MEYIAIISNYYLEYSLDDNHRINLSVNLTENTVVNPDLQLRRGPAFKSLTMDVGFCEDYSGTSRKCAISEKISWGPRPPGSFPWICHCK